MSDIPLQNNLASAINRVRKEFLQTKQAKTYRQITDEFAKQFAEHVEYLLSEMPGSHSAHAVHNMNFALEGEVWDEKLLSTGWGIDPPEHFTWNILNHIQMPAHVWVTCNRRHYDAECAAGVDSFFDLPAFRRAIVNFLRKHGLEMDDVEADEAIVRL